MSDSPPKRHVAQRRASTRPSPALSPPATSADHTSEMPIDPLHTARDYNGALAWPVRLAHRAVAHARGAWRTLTGDAWGLWALVLLAFLLVLPMDAWLKSLATRITDTGIIRGDIRREIEAIQQYGQMTISLAVAAAIFLLDPARRRRLLDWAAAALITWLLVHGLKLLFARGRPRKGVTDDPTDFLGPWGYWPAPGPRDEAGNVTYTLKHAWSLGSDWQAMPSSHTALAAVMSVVLGTLYPRLRPLAWTLAIVVALCRVLLDAHWPSDVAVGGALGAAVGVMVMRLGKKPSER